MPRTWVIKMFGISASITHSARLIDGKMAIFVTRVRSLSFVAERAGETSTFSDPRAVRSIAPDKIWLKRNLVP
jgi:hypothetical protein